MLVALACAPASAQSWDDVKAAWTAQGISPAILYQGDTAANLLGGAKRGVAYSGNLHGQLSLDGGQLLGVPGLTAFADGLSVHGGQPSGLSGDAQGISNIAAPATVELYEAWIQYNFPGNWISLLAGRYDINTEFYRLRAADLFLNSSFGIGPELSQSGFAGPSTFPDTSAGLRITYKPTPNIIVRAAALTGAPVDSALGGARPTAPDSGALLVGEVAFLDRPGPDMPPGMMRSLIGRAPTLAPYDDKIALGGWYYTASFPDLSEAGASGPLRHRGSGGAYLIAEKLLYAPADNSAERVSTFLQAGLGDDRVDRFGAYLGFGATATGFVPGRPNDQFGFGFAMGRNGSHFMESQASAGIAEKGAETAFEATYLAQITDWLAVQPDLQYVVHPNTDPKTRDALVFQLQFEVSL